MPAPTTSSYGILPSVLGLVVGGQAVWTGVRCTSVLVQWYSLV